MTIHNCPRCELRFNHRGEVEDHLRHDHPVSTGIVGEIPAVDLSPRVAVDDGTGPHVVAALDPHRPASPAGEVAGRLARRTGAWLTLASVLPPDLPRDTVEVFLRVERARRDHDLVSTVELEGENVVLPLLAHIQEHRPDLVVLDSHGRSPLGELILGSVSADIVRSSPAPTLVVGPECGLDLAPARLVVAVDGSDDSLGALDVALQVGRAFDLDVELVEVVGEHIADRAPAGDLSETAEVHRIAIAQDPPLDSWDTLHGEDVSDVLVDHVRGDRDVILVLGSHGRSPGRPRVLGGVAARTVRHASVPVLVVSPEAAEHAPRVANGSVTA